MPDSPVFCPVYSRQTVKKLRLTNLSFEEWIEHAFSREVRIQQAVWYFDPNHASEVARIIDAFVLSQTELDPRLRAYANAARCGCVL